jgi:hypothetical protein
MAGVGACLAEGLSKTLPGLSSSGLGLPWTVSCGVRYSDPASPPIMLYLGLYTQANAIPVVL